MTFPIKFHHGCAPKLQVVASVGNCGRIGPVTLWLHWSPQCNTSASTFVRKPFRMLVQLCFFALAMAEVCDLSIQLWVISVGLICNGCLS